MLDKLCYSIIRAKSNAYLISLIALTHVSLFNSSVQSNKSSPTDSPFHNSSLTLDLLELKSLQTLSPTLFFSIQHDAQH